MEKEEIIIDTPVKVCGMTVIPVVQVSTSCFSKKKRLSSFCTKKPLYVVIVKESEIKAFDMDGSQVEIDGLIEAVPGLKKVI
ncbi:MAG: hypothetical protein PHF74_06115 [Dehalococcoidales bacterium]|nr:hypothetical protein [Dehalococcoidales bacterium]